MTRDDRGLAEIGPFLRRTAAEADRTYRVELLWAVEDGLCRDLRSQPLDQAAFDAFWA